MTARKSERLLNLLITLLVARTYVSKERLREVVEDYREAGDDAFEKMFERDKEELRSLGIPIEVGYVDRGFEDEPGYRIERSAFELPDIDLEPEEAAVIGLAARVWQHAGLAAATSDALVKLKAAGVSVDRDGARRRPAAARPPRSRPSSRSGTPPAPAPRSASTTGRSGGARGHHPAPPAVGRGLLPRPLVRRRATTPTATAAADLPALPGRRATVPADGAAGSFEVPAGTDLRALTPRWRPPPPTAPPRCWCAQGAGHGLRRHAEPRRRRRPGAPGAGTG